MTKTIIKLIFQRNKTQQFSQYQNNLRPCLVELGKVQERDFKDQKITNLPKWAEM